jgi:hypothetical protein
MPMRLAGLRMISLTVLTTYYIIITRIRITRNSSPIIKGKVITATNKLKRSTFEAYADVFHKFMLYCDLDTGSEHYDVSLLKKSIFAYFFSNR